MKDNNVKWISIEPERLDKDVINTYQELLYYFPHLKSLTTANEIFAMKILHHEVNQESLMKIFIKSGQMFVQIMGNRSIKKDLKLIAKTMMMLFTTNI
jgi:hypothetical protein